MTLATHQAILREPCVATSLVDVTSTISTALQLPCRVLFKNESEQPSGSFKLRGIGRLVTELIKKAHKLGRQQIHIFASSGGNAGLAAAYAAKFHGVGCTVVVPVIASKAVIAKLENYGARVMLFGDSINEADQHAKSLMAAAPAEVYTIYCHPFDNPVIWEGHSTIMDEVFDALTLLERGKVRGVVCSIGGGGLYNGIMAGLKRNNSSADCLLVETTQAPTLTESVKRDSVVRLNLVKSVATSLACLYVSESTLNNFREQSQNRTHLRAIDDLDAVRGSVAYHQDFGQPIEPACGAAVSVVYNQLDFLTHSIPDLAKDDIVVVIVCGGSCADEASMQQYRKMLRGSKI